MLQRALLLGFSSGNNWLNKSSVAREESSHVDGGNKAGEETLCRDGKSRL